MQWCMYSHTCAPVDVTVELIVVDDFSLDDAFLILQTLVGQMSLQVKRLLDGSTCLRFRHCMEEHKLDEQILSMVDALLSKRCLLLKADTVVDAILTAAPTFIKNKDKSRDPEMHFSTKGNQWCMIEDHLNEWGTKGASVQTPSRGWCAACSEPPAMPDTSSRESRCSVGLMRWPWAMRATTALKSARMQGLRSTGTSRCARENTVRSTNRAKSG